MAYYINLKLFFPKNINNNHLLAVLIIKKINIIYLRSNVN